MMKSFTLSVLASLLAVSCSSVHPVRQVASVKTGECEYLEGVKALAETLYLENQEMGNKEYCNGNADGQLMYRTYFYKTLKLSKVLQTSIIPETETPELKEAITELAHNLDLTLEAASKNGQILSGTQSKAAQCKSLRTGLITFHANLNIIVDQCQ